MNTILVHNLPNSASKADLEEIFSSIGPIKTCKILKKDMNDVGLVTFALEDDMHQALNTPLKLGGSKLSVSLPDGEKLPRKNTFKINKDKEYRERKKSKKGKIIIKNLDFNVTPHILENAFKKFGKIVEVKIPLKEDGKSRGFGFVQFENAIDAHKAITKLNKTVLFKRPVAIDFAMSKDKYLALKNAGMKQGVKTEDTGPCKEESDQESDSKDEAGNSGIKNVKSFKEERLSSEEENSSDEEENSRDEEKNSSSEEEDEEEKANDSEKGNSIKNDTENETDEESEADSTSESKNKKKRHKPSDVNEGKTLFIRNISFDVDEATLHNTFSQFGPLKYSLLCVDKETNFPKGTGFVQFYNKEDADSCLEQVKENPIFLDHRQIEVLLARPKKELAAEKAKKVKTGKDNRNLALLREGYLAMGDAEKLGVSKTDIMLRQKFEKGRKIALQDLMKFVSKTRLIVYNIPPAIDDAKLRSIFITAAGKGAKITECRVMKNLKSLGLDGKPTSKGFGYVNFATHEQALTALRNVNNKEKIFKPHRRPIVYFSIEDLNALRCKELRQNRSQQKIKASSQEIEEDEDQEKEGVAKAKVQNFNFKKKSHNWNSGFQKKKRPFSGKGGEEQPLKKMKFDAPPKSTHSFKKQKKFNKQHKQKGKKKK